METMDIIRALWDKDGHGDNLTVIQFSLERLDEKTGDTIEQISELTTREPLASLADIGGYTTIRITYKYSTASEFSRIRTIAEDYSKIMTEFMRSGSGKGMPCLKITIRPMSIAGAMITAVNPIFHNMQPHDPMYSECNEMQFLFLPDNVGFYEVPDFDEEAASEEVRAELAAEEAAARNAEKKKEEREAYQRERDKEIDENYSGRFGINGGHASMNAGHGFGKDGDTYIEQNNK